MIRNPLRLFLLSLICAFAVGSGGVGAEVLPFGEDGKFKMLYDARQRPQSVYLKGRLYIVYNADAKPTKNGKGSARPMLITYDPESRAFSAEVKLGSRDSDHHFSPIIWADEGDQLHVLHGCHRTPGTHLVSTKPVRAGTSEIDWREAPQIAPSLSYPTVFRVHGDREIIYYRTGGHTSSWTYRISPDSHLDWSSYQTKLPSRDGHHLHVVYTDYDDNKNSPEPERFFNPRYDREVSNEWKYNLSYLRIDLQSHSVCNANGQRLRTPIDLDYSKANCQIWDTDWRGAGVPPAVALDADGNPTFLHVLSGEKELESQHYHYVRQENGKWLKNLICASSHQWNSCHLRHAIDGRIHAFVVVGDSYLKGGYMDRHGGGRIEEWISRDQGFTWNRQRTISPVRKPHQGWRFNNVQPVLRPDGSELEGMLLFYGWKDQDAPKAKAFLLHE